MTTEAPPRLLPADEFFELPDPSDGGRWSSSAEGWLRKNLLVTNILTSQSS